MCPQQALPGLPEACRIGAWQCKRDVLPQPEHKKPLLKLYSLFLGMQAVKAEARAPLPQEYGWEEENYQYSLRYLGHGEPQALGRLTSAQGEYAYFLAYHGRELNQPPHKPVPYKGYVEEEQKGGRKAAPALRTGFSREDIVGDSEWGA